MTKTRRFLIYFIGFFLGCVMVYFVLFRGRDRTYWLPDNRIKNGILQSELIYSPHALCIMNCRQIKKEDIQQVLKTGEVNYDESNIHNTACPSYAIDGSVADKKLRIIITTVDSVSEVESAIDLNVKKDSCHCR